MTRAIATAALLVACLPVAAKELRFAMAGDPKTFDPLQVAESNSETVRYLTGGVLVRVNRATGRVEPELAESWSVTDAGKGIAFRLRAGLKFSDGSPLSADDVARTLKRALDPKEASPAGDAFRASSGDPSIMVSSPRDIALRYRTAKPNLDRLFDTLAIAKGKASSGPYLVAEYRAGEYVRLTKNPYYWKHDSSGRQLPYIEGIRIDIQQNHDIELARFLRGELHLIPKLDGDAFDRVAKAQASAARNLGASLDSEFLWFNQTPVKTVPEWKQRWFASAAFRHAISGAIRRADLARVVFRGHAHAARGPISPANAFWFNAALKPPAADPLRLLNAEGFTLRGGVLRDREGREVEFSLITNSGNRARERMAALVQSDLRAIGIRVNVVTLEFGSLIERIAKSFDYEAALLGFTNVEEDPLEQMNVWLSSGAQHAWRPSQKTPATEWEAQIDRLELQQAGEADRLARKKALDEVQRIAMEQEPIVYLVNPDYLCAISPSLKGVNPGIAPPQILWNIEWLRLE